MTAFGTAALVLVGLLFTAAVTIAGARQRTVGRIARQAPTIKKWGGWIMFTVGVWLVVLAVFADFFARLFPV